MAARLLLAVVVLTCHGCGEADQAAILRETLPAGSVVDEPRCDSGIASETYSADMPIALRERESALRTLRRLSSLADTVVRGQVGVTVNDQGLVEDVRLIRGSGQAWLDSLMLRFQYSLEYHPAQKDGLAVCSHLVLPLYLQPNS